MERFYRSSWRCVFWVCLGLLLALPAQISYAKSTSAQLEAAFDRASRSSCGGLCSSVVFQAAYYLRHHSDVRRAVGNNPRKAKEHWLRYGIREGRQASSLFDVKYYLKHHVDVRRSVGAKNYKGGLLHFLKYGAQEGRKTTATFSIKRYLSKHRRLLGSKSYKAAYMHWVFFQLPAQPLTVKYVGRCQAKRQGSRTYQVRCHGLPGITMYGSIKSATSYNLKTKTTGTSRTFSLLLPRKLRKPFRFLLAGSHIRKMGIALHPQHGFHLVGQLNLARTRRNANLLGKVLSNFHRGMSSLIRSLPTTFNVAVYPAHGHGVAAITLKVELYKSCLSLGEIIPKVGTKLKVQGLDLLLKVKADPNISISAGAVGTLFLKPSQADPWLKIKPSIEIVPKTMALIVGGAIVGACGARTCGGFCTRSWHPLGLRPLSARSSALQINFSKTGQVTGFAVAINKGKLFSYTVTGGLKFAPAKMKCGLYIKRNRVPFLIVFEVLRKIGTFRRVIPKGLAFKDVEILVSPTGGKIGNVKFAQGIRFKGHVNTEWFKGRVDATGKAVLKKRIMLDLHEMAETELKANLSIKGFNKLVLREVRRIRGLGPIMREVVKTFSFESLHLHLQHHSDRASGKATFKFRAFGKNMNPTVNVKDVPVSRIAIARFVAKALQGLAADLGKIVLEAVRKAAQELEKTGKLAARDVSQGMKLAVRVADSEAKKLGENLVSGVKLLGKQFEHLGGSVAGFTVEAWDDVKCFFGSCPRPSPPQPTFKDRFRIFKAWASKTADALRKQAERNALSLLLRSARSLRKLSPSQQTKLFKPVWERFMRRTLQGWVKAYRDKRYKAIFRKHEFHPKQQRKHLSKKRKVRKAYLRIIRVGFALMLESFEVIRVKDLKALLRKLKCNQGLCGNRKPRRAGFRGLRNLSRQLTRPIRWLVYQNKVRHYKTLRKAFKVPFEKEFPALRLRSTDYRRYTQQFNSMTK